MPRAECVAGFRGRWRNGCITLMAQVTLCRHTPLCAGTALALNVTFQLRDSPKSGRGAAILAASPGSQTQEGDTQAR